MAVRHTRLGFSPSKAKDAILDGKSVQMEVLRDHVIVQMEVYLV